MAQAIADQLKMKLSVVGTGDIETSEPGGAERNIKELFKTNRGGKNIICFDECDSLLSSREEVGVIMAAQINALLTEIEQYDGVVILTTNRLGKLDPALERRITAKIEFEFPDEEARLSIWKRMIPSKAPLAKDVNFKRLAEFPLSGGNIKNAVLNAARKAAYEGMSEITMECFVHSSQKEIESTQAFVSAYEQSVHSRQLGGVSREPGKIVLTDEQKEEVVEDIDNIKDKVRKMTKENKAKAISKKGKSK
jgi:SpoVK/Ycf46/Vps4 family AAA+-type ATPase